MISKKNLAFLTLATFNSMAQEVGFTPKNEVFGYKSPIFYSYLTPVENIQDFPNENILFENCFKEGEFDVCILRSDFLDYTPLKNDNLVNLNLKNKNSIYLGVTYRF